MNSKFLFRRVACAFLVVVLAGSFLAAPGQTVLAGPLAGAFTDCASQTQIPVAECNALVALYNSTGGANWTNHTGWLQTDTPCSWYAVSCENSGSHVTYLYLENNNLVGSIPPELGNLSNLYWLGLNSNQLTGAIPSSLGNLTTLYWLYLDHNQLTGTIPPSLGNLVNATDFALNYNRLTGTIPVALGNLSGVTYLDLSFNQLSGSIPTQLGSLPIIISLWLNNNQLTGTIPPSLGNLTALQILNLSFNKLSGPIPTEFGNLQGLNYLDLNDNKLSGPMPAELTTLTGLDRLSLGNNKLSGEIPATIVNMVELYQLSLSCRLTSTNPAVIAFVEALIPDWQDQQCLAFEGCTKQTQIPVAECNALVTLYNRTGGPNWTNNAGWLETNTPCGWSGIACEDAGTNVTDIYLENNNLVGTIPPDLDSLTKLEWLALNSNRLTGTIPPRLGNITTLYWLYLDYNQLTGSIPASLGKLVNVTDLQLQNNRLTGSIPPQLGNMVSLTSLILDNNRLSGPIPKQLGNLPILAALILSHNQLSGRIPKELGNLSAVQVLDLSYNKLSGPIPAEFGNLKNLNFLTLNNNQLSGSLPAEMGNLTGLDMMYLANNKLTGEIPHSIVNMSELAYLTLSCQMISSDPAVIAFVDALVPGWQSQQCLPKKTLTSNAAQDGWVIESNEDSEVGGTMNSSALTFQLGDNIGRRQYVSVLSFSTGAALPDTAVITHVMLRIKQQDIVGGGDPVEIFQGFMLDVRSGYLGVSPVLQIGDFQAVASRTYGPLTPTPSSSWYAFDLTDAKDLVNKVNVAFGLTQVRLRFQLDDNDDEFANYMTFFSGSGPAVSRPQLIVEYYVP
jgi:Leucine-rich repeat (LRR) protein